MKRRIAAVAGAAALAVSLAVLSAPAALAANHSILNAGYDATIESHGSGAAVTLGGSELYDAIDPVKVGTHTVYQYEYVESNGTLSGLCLQANTVDTVVSEGGCQNGNARQQWWWDNLTYLINKAFGTYAYATSVKSEVDLAGSGYCTDNSQCYWEVN